MKQIVALFIGLLSVSTLSYAHKPRPQACVVALKELVYNPPGIRLKRNGLVPELIKIGSALSCGALGAGCLNLYWGTVPAYQAIRRVHVRHQFLARHGRQLCERMRLHMREVDQREREREHEMRDRDEMALSATQRVAEQQLSPGLLSKQNQLEIRTLLVFALCGVFGYVLAHRYWPTRMLRARQRLNAVAAVWIWYKHRVPRQFVNIFTVLHELYMMNGGDIGFDEERAAHWLKVIEEGVQRIESQSYFGKSA